MSNSFEDRQKELEFGRRFHQLVEENLLETGGDTPESVIRAVELANEALMPEYTDLTYELDEAS